MLGVLVDNVPVPYEISKVLPDLIQEFPNLEKGYMDFAFWENSGLLEGLENKEKFELSVLLHKVIVYCFDVYEDKKSKKYLSDRESDILIYLVTRLYRRNRLNDFHFVINSFNNIRISVVSIFEEISSYPTYNADAEITILICQTIEEDLGIKHDDHFNF